MTIILYYLITSKVSGGQNHLVIYLHTSLTFGHPLLGALMKIFEAFDRVWHALLLSSSKLPSMGSRLQSVVSSAIIFHRYIF